MKIQILAAILLVFSLCPTVKVLQLLRNPLASLGALSESAIDSLTDIFNTDDTKEVEGAYATADSSDTSKSSEKMEMKNMSKSVEKEIFDILDKNHDAFIDRSELMALKRPNKCQVSYNEAMDIIQAVSTDDDGKIDFHEAYPVLIAC